MRKNWDYSTRRNWVKVEVIKPIYAKLTAKEVRTFSNNIPQYSDWELVFYQSIKVEGFKFTSPKQYDVIKRMLLKTKKRNPPK